MTWAPSLCCQSCSSVADTGDSAASPVTMCHCTAERFTELLLPWNIHIDTDRLPVVQHTEHTPTNFKHATNAKLEKGKQKKKKKGGTYTGDDKLLELTETSAKHPTSDCRPPSLPLWRNDARRRLEAETKDGTLSKMGHSTAKIVWQPAGLNV